MSVVSFCGLCLLLICGKFLRVRLQILQRLYLPSSVIGGLLGLLFLTLFPEWVPEDLHNDWSKLPSFLINIVFAALFLGAPIPGLKTVWKNAAPQLCMGQILAWGQYVFAALLTLLILQPLYGVKDEFAALLEIGFEGGHGTAAGLKQTFIDFGFAAGQELSYTMATIGMITGVVLGMFLINIAVRKKWIGNIRPFSDKTPQEQSGIIPRNEQPVAGKQTVFADSIDSLALHIAFLGIAVLLGYLLKIGMASCNAYMPESIQTLKILDSFPLFPLCMIGGLVLQKILSVAKIEYLVDGGLVSRLAGAALDFLVVSAIATIKLSVVIDYWQPLLLLCIVGIAWALFVVLWMAPRMFEDAWFERAIAEFGQTCGVTATGLLLLRTVDPQSKTRAAEAFGYKQLLHEPFMGGGICTSMAIPLLQTRGLLFVFVVSFLFLMGWIIFWLLTCRVKPNRQQ